MIPHENSEALLYRARCLLKEESYDDAIAMLNALYAASTVGEQQKELTYLLGWCYMQQKEWVRSCLVLTPLLAIREPQFYVLGPGMSEYERSRFQLDLLQEREQQALTLLLLGLSAINLAMYEDASLHLMHCLRVLHDRRVHLPRVRIYARFSLAMTCLMRGLYTQAQDHYEVALHLCAHYMDDEAVPDIYHGLCDVYRAQGDLQNSYTTGVRALRLYEEREDMRMIARIHSMLGHVCLLLQRYQEARTHYQQSLAIATVGGGTTLVMLDYAALAEVGMAEHDMHAVQHYCTLALDTLGRSDDVHMQGRVGLAIAKIVHQEARQTLSKEQSFLEVAVLWYEYASACLEMTQAYDDIVELHSGWGEALEALGRTEEAIQCWRSGYQALRRTDQTTQNFSSLSSLIPLASY